MSRVARTGLVFGSVIALLVVTGCTAGTSAPGASPTPTTPGVTDTEIVVGTHQPFTGLASGGSAKIGSATKAYFDYVNASGGVHGRKIVYRIMDDASNPDTAQAVVRQLVQQDKVFAILNGLGTRAHMGVLDFLTENKVPDLFVGSGSPGWNQPDRHPMTFGYQPDHTTEGKILAGYVQTAFPDKKVCFLGQDDEFGRDALQGIERILGERVVAKQRYAPADTSVAAQVGVLKAAGCEVVMLATEPRFTALAVAAAANLGGFKPQFVSSGVGGDYLAVGNELGAGRSLLDGFISAGYLPPVADVTNPWNVLFKKINAERNRGAPYDANVVYGMSVGYLFVQALQRAGENLSRVSLVEAVERGGFTGGPGLAPLSYAPGNHAGFSGVRLATVTKGVQQYFGPVYQTDSGVGPIIEYTTPAAAPPTNGIPAG
jgi:ABC-type branched-subunit amino acid transport system substrate-binding protein